MVEPEWNPQVALDALYAGPSKKDGNLRFISCESTGAKVTSIESGLASVELKVVVVDAERWRVYMT